MLVENLRSTVSSVHIAYCDVTIVLLWMWHVSLLSFVLLWISDKKIGMFKNYRKADKVIDLKQQMSVWLNCLQHIKNFLASDLCRKLEIFMYS